MYNDIVTPANVSTPPRPKPKPQGAGPDSPVKTTTTASGAVREMRPFQLGEGFQLFCPYCWHAQGTTYGEQCGLCGGQVLPQGTYPTSVTINGRALPVPRGGSGDGPSPATVARFWTKVNKDRPIPADRPELGPCWLWTGSLNSHGYGVFGRGRRGRNGLPTFFAHRIAYLLSVGPIPDGLQPDHLCRNHSCVNPDHVEPVTGQVNTLRGNTIPAAHALKTQCPSGHPYDEVNTRWYQGRRYCRACDLIKTWKRRGIGFTTVNGMPVREVSVTLNGKAVPHGY